MPVALKDLTPGERLRIARRRDDHTQQQVAEWMEIPLSMYKRMEADEIPPPADHRAPALHRLRPYEQCCVMRWRKRWTLDRLAKESGLSKFYLCQIERGHAPATTLIGFWTA